MLLVEHISIKIIDFHLKYYGLFLYIWLPHSWNVLPEKTNSLDLAYKVQQNLDLLQKIQVVRKYDCLHLKT